MKNTIYLLFIIFFGFSCTAQPHTDLQEQGIKGKVKKMVIENYLDVPASCNKDSATLYERDIFYYNETGNLDSAITFTGPDKAGLKRTQQSIISAIHGQKQEIIHNYQTEQTDTVHYTWLSDTSYQKAIHNKINGQTTTTTYYLDAAHQVYKMTVLLTDVSGHTLFSQGSERYDKDSRGLYQKVLFSFSDINNGATEKGAMVYSEFDKYNNPGRAVLSHLDDPDKTEMRIFKYSY